MPYVYDVESPWTGQKHVIEFETEPDDTSIDEATAFADNLWKESQVKQQGQAGTLFNSMAAEFAKNYPRSGGGAAEGLDKATDIAAQATGTDKGGLFRSVADNVDQLQHFIDETYPVNPENKAAATIGGGIGQVASLIAGGLLMKGVGLSAEVATKVPLWLGFTSGMGEGIKKAEEMGVNSTETHLGFGLLLGGIEMATEKLGGFGNKAATDALMDLYRKPAEEMLKGAVKSIVSEGAEEVLAGSAQDVAVDLLARAYSLEDPNRPGWTVTGVELPKLDWAMVERRGLEFLGGAAGGSVFAGANLLANRFKPVQGSAGDTATAPMQPGLEEDLGELTADDVQDLARPEPVFEEAEVPPAGVIVPEPPAKVISPELRAELDAAELDRQRQIARLRGEQQRAGNLMPVIPDSPLGGRDILDFINENPLLVPRKGSDAAGAAEYDWRETYDIPMYYRKFLARADRGRNAADLADMAWREGYIAEASPDALMGAIRSTIEGRTSYRVQMRQREKALNQEAAQVTRFEKAQARAGDKTLLALEDVTEGDEMTIEGEKAVVKKVEWDEDGYLTNVVIEDGKRFGVLSLDPQTRAGVFVDEWQPKDKATAAAVEADPFALESATPEELEAEQQRAEQRAKMAEMQQRQLKGDAGEYGTPDMLDPTAGDMALFNQGGDNRFAGQNAEGLHRELVPGTMPTNVSLPTDFTDAEAQQRTADLRKSLRSDGYPTRYTGIKPVLTGQLAKLLGRKPSLDFARAIADVFGRRIVVLEGLTADDFGANTNRNIRDTIFLNAEAATPHEFLTGHELLHHLRLAHPDLYNRLDAVLRPRIIRVAEAHQEYSEYAKVSDDRVREEVYADLLGASISDPVFWERMADLEPRLFMPLARTVWAWFKDLIDGLRSRGWTASRYFRDLEAAQSMLAQAMAEFARREGGMTPQSAQQAVRAVVGGDNFFQNMQPKEVMPGAEGDLEGPSPGRETRARFARPEAEERYYETRADRAVKGMAEAWLDGRTPSDAVRQLEEKDLPESLTQDVAQQATGILLQRLRLDMKDPGRTELQRMESRALANRAAKVFQGWLSQEAARSMRQRAVVNAELAPIAPILLAEGLLIDRGEAVMDARFDGGAEGAAAKVEDISRTAADDASDIVERILGTVLGNRLAPRQTVAEAVRDLLNGSDQRQQMIQEVAQALMLKARARAVTPQRKTALGALAASLKRTLGAAVRGEARPAPTESTGEILARAFVDQVAEAETFAESWEAGRQRVFDMLFDMELDSRYHPARLRRADRAARLQHLVAGNEEQRLAAAAEMRQLSDEIEQLDAEMEQAHEAAVAKTADFWTQVDGWLPPTPTIAYAPGMAQEAIKRGFEAAGYTATLATGMDKAGERTLSIRDALIDRARATAAVMRVWDAEATTAGISPEAWTAGRALAQQALQETLDTWQAQEDARQRSRDADKRAQLLTEESPSLMALMNQLRGKVAPDMTWKNIFMDLPSTQKDRQREIYRRIFQHERLRNLSAEETLKLTNELDKAWQKQRREVFNQELKRVGVLGEKSSRDLKKVKKALPKLLRMINLGMFNSSMYREAVAPEYGVGQITAAEASRLQDLAEKAWEQPEGILRNKELEKLLWAIRKQTKVPWTEIMNSYWTAAVLSGLRTQFDTFMSIGNGLLTNTLQSAAILFRTGGNRKATIEVQAEWWKNLYQGVKEALWIIRKGDHSFLKKYGQDLEKALEGERMFGPMPLGEELFKHGNLWQKWGLSWVMMFTGRLMSAADHINNTATTQGAIAAARAMHPEFYNGQAGYTKQDRADARAQALREITGGTEPGTPRLPGQTSMRPSLQSLADFVRGREDGVYAIKRRIDARTREILAEGLRPEDLEAANTIGDMAAFQNDPTGAFGFAYSGFKRGLGGLQQMAEEHSKDEEANKFGRAATAVIGASIYALTGTRFMRFGFNFGADLTRYIPGTFLLGKLDFYGKKTSQMERDLLMGKNIIGLLLTAGLAAYFLGGDDADDEEGWQIEGDWSNLSQSQQRQLMSAGLQRMSLWRRVNGKVETISYKQWPTMAIFAIIGGMKNEQRYKPEEWAQRGMAGHLLRGLWSGAFQVQNVSAMRGLVEVMGTPQFAADPITEWRDRFAKMGANWMSGFVPTALKDADFLNDPRNFKPDGVLEQMARGIPIYRRTLNDGRPMLNVLGEEVRLDRSPWSRSYTSVQTGEAHRLLGALMARGITLPQADDSKRVVHEGEKVKLGDLGGTTVWRYQKAVGQAYQELLATEGQKLLLMEPERAQRILNRYTDRIKDRAAAQVMARHGR